MSKTGKIILGVIAVIIVIPIIGVLTIFVVSYRTFGSVNRSFNEEVAQMSGGTVASVASPSSPSYALRDTAATAGNGGASERMPMPIIPPTPVSGGVVAPNIPDRMIIKTGEMSVVVKDVRDSISKISSYTEQNGGFVVSSNISQSSNSPYGTVTIRIPADKFDMSVSEIKSYGEVVSETTQGEDVTAQYVDLDAQLTNLQATEQQFLAIMKQATKIQDILDVQNQLTTVRGQIQSIQGQMKYLKESAQLSSLTITLSTDPSTLPVVKTQGEQWKPWAQVKDAARSLVEVGKGLVSFLIWVLVYIPVWGLILIIILIIRWRVKRKKMMAK